MEFVRSADPQQLWQREPDMRNGGFLARTSEERLSPTQMRRVLCFGTYRTIWNMCVRWDALSGTFEVYRLVGDHHRRKRP